MSNTFTIEDILNARPESLKDRAIKAHEREIEQKRVEEENTFDSLMLDTRLFLSDELGMTDAEIADINFSQEHYGSEKNPCLRFTVEDIKFQTRYWREKVLTKDTDSFGRESIYTDSLMCEASR
jgi:hypothetical protein